MRPIPKILALVLLIIGSEAQGQSTGIDQRTDGQLFLPFRPQPTSVPNAAVSQQFVLERSEDLANWETVNEIDLSNAYAYQGGLRVPEDLLGSSQAYFRFRIERTVRYTTDKASEYLGLEGPFTEALLEQFFTEPEDLRPRYLERAYAGDHPWDPSTGQFWDLFATDPAENNAGRNPAVDGWRAIDYRLNAEEEAVFKKQGFVVSERLGGETFGDAFYELWSDDMPVFISTDALLHAWHYSFRSSLSEIDQFIMAPELGNLIGQLLSTLESHQALYDRSDPFLQRSFEDIDWFLTIALSLLEDELLPARLVGTPPLSWVYDSANTAEEADAVDEIFGQERLVDFTQFKPRGHYTASPLLRKYFRAMMWCLTIDYRLTPSVEERDQPSAQDAARRQLGAASLLAQLLQEASLTEAWQSMEGVIAAVGGYGDALAPPQLLELLKGNDTLDVGSLSDSAMVEALQTQLLEGSLGIQNIRSRPTLTPTGQQQAVLPRSFTFFSQRFVLDSWAMSKVVFDSIIFDDNGIPESTDKVQRRIPSGLDVAFATLGNNAALPTLIDRMGDTNGRAFRDGLPYQNNLAAVREVIDGQGPQAWEGNVYHHWLGTLRELSHLPSGPGLPHAMRTRAWAMKDLNTQLASWTQLRHDTILYAKQSSTGLSLCLFPDGFVEPRPRFWSQLRSMAKSMQGLIGALPKQGVLEERLVDGWFTPETDVDAWQAGLSRFYENFAQCVGRLEGLVEKELNLEAFTESDLTFIDGLIQAGGEIGSGGERRYDGWYPALFYGRLNELSENGSVQFDALVTDVHTDFPDFISGDPGTILHEAVGGVPFLLIAAEREDGRRAVYGGPVLSHYEFDTGDKLERLTDEEWKGRLKFEGHIPKNGHWTRDYLVPAKDGIPMPLW